jgi:acyl-CoA-binding protein
MADDAAAALFEEAVAYVRSLPDKPRAGDAPPPTTEQRLAFYALYKQARPAARLIRARRLPLMTRVAAWLLRARQATVGPQPAGAARPRAYDPTGQFKHDAWATLGGMGATEARGRYVDTLALAVLCGAAEEARAGGSGACGYYARALAADAPPPFLRRVLAPAPGAAAPLPRRRARLHTARDATPPGTPCAR